MKIALKHRLKEDKLTLQDLAPSEVFKTQKEGIVFFMRTQGDYAHNSVNISNGMVHNFMDDTEVFLVNGTFREE